MGFFIERLIVSGPEKTDSIINLQDGVNIICGPSNTGKTYIIKCIDYIFGSENEPIDPETGYDTITLVAKTPQGNVTMSRKIGSNKYSVKSDLADIISGEYIAKATQKQFSNSISAVWLSLIGIKDLHRINFNANKLKRTLTWRTFSHICLLTEQRMISPTSVLLPEVVINNTLTLSALLFLLFGQDYSDESTEESKVVREARKEAVSKYISDDLFYISDRKREIAEILKDESGIDIHQEIDSISNKIQETESQITKALEKNRHILSSINYQNEKLSECTLLQERLEMLSTQYSSDLERLSFIVDGNLNYANNPLVHCPFCNGKVKHGKTPNYIEAAKAEFKQISSQSKDLEEARDELAYEHLAIETEIKNLLEEKTSIESLINNELEPELNSLKDVLAQYKTVIEFEREIAVLQTIADRKQQDYLKVQSGDADDTHPFDPKDHFNYELISEICNNLKIILKKCNYPNLTSVDFEMSVMDIVVNGKKKKSNGKGYIAYLNSIMAIGFAQYLKKNAKYCPGVVILDSPILSLKEKESQQASTSMRAGLFEYIVKNTEGIQTIIAENEIPVVNYTGANVIQFTKNTKEGRYGFLMDVVE